MPPQEEERPEPRRRPSGAPLPPSAKRLEDLLARLQGHTEQIRESWQAGDAARLRALAAQLATLARGAGEAEMSESAAELEAMLMAEEAEASAMCEQVEALIQMCRRVDTPST